MKKHLLKKKNVLFLFSCIATLFLTGNAFAQLSITTPGSTITQNFDGLPSTGTLITPSGGIFSAGWSFLETGTNANTTYSTDTGSSNSGNTYSYGIAGTNVVTDRALGMLQSGSLSSILGFKFINNTGAVVTAITVGYTGELWRKSAANDAISFSYQSGDATLSATTGWTTVTALGFTTPVTGTAAATDGNTTANRTVISPVTITGLNIAAGATFTLRWVDATGASSAGMAIDDFSIVVANPVISVTPTSLSGFATIAGNPSTAQTFTVTGTNLQTTANNLVITAPSGYEVSESGTNTYAASVSFTPTTGTYTKTIDVRISSTATAGTANGDVTIAAASATGKTVSLTGSVTAASFPSLSLSGATAHGTNCLNTAGTPIQYTITNNSSVAADGIKVSSTDPQFAITTPLSSTTIAANGTATFTVTFTPTTVGAQASTLNVTSTTPGTTYNATIPANLTGNGTATVGAVNSAAASSITVTTATLNGNVTTVGVCPATIEKGFVYALTATNNNPVVGGNGVTKTAVGTVAAGAYTLALTSLDMNTGYTFNSYIFDGTSYTYGTTQSFTTVATPPSVTATAITVIAYTTDSVHFNWTNGDGSRRIVVASLSATSAVAPSNGVTYTVNSNSFSDALNSTTGTGNVVVYDGTGSDLNVTGLTAGNTYRFSIYEYNGTATSASYGNAASITKATIAAEPTTPATNLTFTNVSSTGFTLTWVLGNGANSLVVVKDGSAVDAVPTDGVSYTAAGAFGTGSDLGNNNYVVYRAAVNTINVTGLTDGHTYYVAVYTYGGNSGSALENYLVTTPATGSQLATTPVYYSKGSLAPNVLTNWSTATDGTGTSPTSFSSPGKYIIQETHNMTTTGTWSFGAAGSTLEVQNNASLTANNAITIATGTVFHLTNGSSYIHNNTTTASSSIFNGTELFDPTSSVKINNWSGNTASITGGVTLPYGNLELNYTTNSSNWQQGLSGTVNLCAGNFTITSAGSGTFRFTAASAYEITIGGNFTVNATTVSLSSTSGSGVRNIYIGGNYTQGSTSTLTIVSGSTATIHFKGANATFTNNGTSNANGVNWAVDANAGLLLNTDLNVANTSTANVAGTLDFSASKITGAGTVNVASTGTVIIPSTEVTGAIAGNVAATGGLTLAAGSTVVFNAAAAQSITARTDYSNVTFNGSGIKTLLGNTTLANNLTVSNTAQVVVPTGIDLTVNGFTTVAPTAKLTVENNANLLQDAAATTNQNNGNATVLRDAKMWRQDYVYWGAPVTGQNLKAFSPATLDTRFYVLKEDDNTFQSVFSLTGLAANPATYDFVPAKGYMVRAPNTFPNPTASGAAPTETFNGSFTGVPNNGDVSIATPATASQFHMIANPYPSAISGTSFLTANPGTIYFWTHHDQTSGNAVNYATFNLTGGTDAPDYTDAVTPDGSIAVGQGFMFLNQSANTTATFTNAMRTGNNAALFYRDSNMKSRIWINLSKDNTKVNQALVAYITNTTTGFDAGYDGKLIEGGSTISSMIGTDKYAIQARAEFEATDVVPMHFFADAAGNYTISLHNVDGIFADSQDVFLKDNMLNTTTDLKAGAYNFTSEAGAFASRFEVVYQASPLANPVFDLNKVVIFKENNVFNINSGNIDMAKVQVFDIRGSLVYTKENINANTTTLNGLKAAQGVLLVQITSKEGTVVTRKVVN